MMSFITECSTTSSKMFSTRMKLEKSSKISSWKRGNSCSSQQQQSKAFIISIQHIWTKHLSKHPHVNFNSNIYRSRQIHFCHLPQYYYMSYSLWHTWQRHLIQFDTAQEHTTDTKRPLIFQVFAHKMQWDSPGHRTGWAVSACRGWRSGGEPHERNASSLCCCHSQISEN